jgi:hypothetical protein
MAVPVLGILGQQAPAAATNADVYTVPGSRRSVLSTVFVANTSGSATTYRIYLRKAGAAAAVSNAIAYDVNLGANATDAWTVGITLAAADVVTVQSAGGAVSFTVCGEETDVPAA